MFYDSTSTKHTSKITPYDIGHTKARAYLVKDGMGDVVIVVVTKLCNKSWQLYTIATNIRFIINYVVVSDEDRAQPCNIAVGPNIYYHYISVCVLLEEVTVKLNPYYYYYIDRLIKTI